MAEETAEEAAQRVNAKRLAANKKVRTETVPRIHKNNVKTCLRLKEKIIIHIIMCRYIYIPRQSVERIAVKFQSR